MSRVLGIDIGTHGAKTALMDGDGRVIDIESMSYPIQYPQVGWAEQDPEDWWTAIATTIRGLAVRQELKDVSALSLSTQGGVTILLDRDFKPLYPAVSWLDSRAEEISPLIGDQIGPEEVYRLTGLQPKGHLNFSVIIWFREKRPEIFGNTSRFASAVDFLNHRLTGEFVIDLSNLALNALVDLERRDYSDRLLEIAGIPRDCLPKIAPSGMKIGTLTSRAAEDLGLPTGVQVVSGAHDQYCSSVGVGAVDSGVCVLSAGTAWVLLATTDRLLYDIESRTTPGIHVVENRYGLLTSLPAGGASLDWFRKVFREGEPAEMMDDLAEKAETGSSGLIFIPQSGSASGKGAFLGIDSAHGQPHFARAVMEGIALGNQEHLLRIDGMGLNIREITMIGGGASSRIWPGIVADMSGLPVFIPDQREAACAGAGVLALAGTGEFGSIEDAARLMRPAGRSVAPDGDNTQHYSEILKRFRTFSSKL